jgi:flagellar FliJ protein
MTGPESLHTLNLLAERIAAERDTAQTWLAECIQRADQARRSAGELSQYRVDYEQRWGRQFAQAGTMDIVNCYQNFSGRLTEAIHSQEQISRQADARVETARTALLALEMRLAAVKKLMERRQAETMLREQRQEQKASDEFAARVARDRVRNIPSL